MKLMILMFLFKNSTGLIVMENGQVEWEWNERTGSSYLPKQVKKIAKGCGIR